MKSIKFVSTIFASVILLCLLIVFLVYHFTLTPLDGYDFTDCTIEVYGYLSDETTHSLIPVEYEKTVNVLKSAKVFPFEDKNVIGITGEQINQFKITLKNGDMLELGVGSDKYLILNKKFYKCDKDTVNYFHNLFNAVTREDKIQYHEESQSRLSNN